MLFKMRFLALLSITLFLFSALSSSDTVNEVPINIVLDDRYELQCPESDYELKYILFRRSIDNFDVTEINEAQLPDFITEQELQNVSLVIENAHFNNSGRYFCIYSKSNDIVLIQSFLLAVSDTYVYERFAKLKEKLTLYVTGFESADLDEFIWIFNNQIITTDNSNFLIDKATKDLTVEITDPSLFGIYIFKNAKRGEFVLYEIKQHVDEQNNIKAPLVQPYNLDVEVGTPVIFECFNRNLNEEPENYQWYKLDSKEMKNALDQAYLLENAHIKDENFSYSINFTDLKTKYSAALIRNGKVLKLGNVTFTESGWYLCCLVYSHGDIYSEEEPVMKCSGSHLYVSNVSNTFDPTLFNRFEKHKNSKASIFLAVAAPTIIVMILFASISAIMFLYKKLKTISNVQKGREFLHKNDLYMRKYEVGSSYSSTNTQSTPVDNTSAIACDLFKTQSCNNSSETLHSIIQKYLADTSGSKWEIPFENLNFGRVLGMGAFGIVIYGEEHNSIEKSVRSVAIKKLKNNASVANFKELVTELKLMKHVGEHQYIINLLGYTFDRCHNDLYIVTEFAKHGNLKEYLTKYYECDKLKFNENYMPLYAYQIACGMEYLHSKEVLHRDLAARNILVSEDNLVKIADFGLARNIMSDYYYMKQADGRFPIKWMAPEALTHNKITKKSDTWSYGVLLWEIYTYGCAPYPLIAPEEILKYLNGGNRLEKPANCDSKIYEIMLKCWNMNASERPDFTWLADQLNFYLHSNNDLSSLCDLLKIRNSSLSDCDDTTISNLNEKCNSTVSIINSSASASFPSSTSSVGTLEIEYEHKKNELSNHSYTSDSNKDEHEMKPFLESFYTNSDNKQELSYSECRKFPLKEILSSKLKLQSPLNLIRLHRSNQIV